MIVTRQRRRGFRWHKLWFPLIAIALIWFALWWGPSRNAISTGPLAPAWNASAAGLQKVAAPFHFAVQNKQIGDLSAQVKQLTAQVATLQSASAAKDKTISQLHTQLEQAQAQAVAATSPAAKTGASSAPTSIASPVADLASVATADMRRTAADWAAMDPDNAAKVIQKLPVSYVARVLSVMTPEGVGPILDALPATYAAALTQEHPELRR